ncbi:DNA sulfur modification protein DndB [Mesorhizobium sp.]|uniref:DNA sulfur modification protein DndB n=1 Tax=Mesorhizobium sp. TaxID=1871066 RepID=UPI00257DB778|nr:DNA sulfur modification protein DndB [Mesorhizobium sp.]
MAMYNTSLTSANREDVFASYNLGSQTLTMKVPISRFIDMSDVPNEGAVAPDEISQRPLDKKHAASLAIYILKGLIFASMNLRKLRGADISAHDEILERMGAQSYFSLQPIVANLPCTWDALNPNVQTNSVGDPLTVRISTPAGVVMWIIDGQHRRFALNMVLEFLRQIVNNRAYPKRGSLYPFNGEGPGIPPRHLDVWRECHHLAMNHSTVTVEVHLNLDAEQQRQLFHDLNNMGKSVSSSMAFDFDNSNPVNVFIKDVLIDEGLLEAPIAEKDIVDWASHDGSMARKDLVAVNSILFLNRTNPKGATPVQVARMEHMARRFWQSVSAIPGFGEEQAKMKTVAAQPVLLKALAKLAYDFQAGRKADPSHLERLLAGMGTIDFSHDNPMWHVYELSPEERLRKVPGLDAYLPDDDGNRDLGGTDEAGRMRFGAKHNDIYPILGDIIRWKLGLPNRHEDAEVADAA